MHYKIERVWKFDLYNDDSIKWKFKFQNTLHCKQAPYCLLFPRHRSQQSTDANGMSQTHRNHMVELKAKAKGEPQHKQQLQHHLECPRT